MFKFFRRHEDERAPVDHRPPPPMTPIEVGFSLRAARERNGLSLEELRSRTDVPMLDLEALERGRLDVFHVEQAAIVVLWRYAEVVGIEPENLVDVIHRSWPNPSSSVDYFPMTGTLIATPLSQLAQATSMLAPIVKPRELNSGAALGLSPAMLAVLTTASVSAVGAVGSLGPVRQEVPAISSRGASNPATKKASLPKASGKSATKPSSKSSAKTGTKPGGKGGAKPGAKSLGTGKKTSRPSVAPEIEIPITPVAAVEPEIALNTPARVDVSLPAFEDTMQGAGGSGTEMEAVPTPTAVVPPHADEVVAEQFADPIAVAPVEQAPIEHVSDEQAPDFAPAPTVTASFPQPAERVEGRWMARLSKVIAERFGVEEETES